MSEPQDRPVSCYRSATRSKFAQVDKPMDEVLPAIVRSRSLEALTAEYREALAASLAEPDDEDLEEIAERMKRALPCITPSAAFGRGPRWTDVRRAKEKYQGEPRRPTGAVPLDLDGLGDEAQAVRQLAAEVNSGRKPHTLAAFISPSGENLKVLVHVSPLPYTDEEHEAAFMAVLGVYRNRLGIEPPDGPAQRDPTRLMFLSHDAGAVLRPSGSTFPIIWR